jgi:uncharacterized integral membrane protein
MSEHERETTFLRRCLLYEDDTAERRQLEAGMTVAQHDVRCVRRAVRLMIFLVALASSGLCYSAILFTDFPATVTQFMMPLTVKIFAALSVTALICLLAFAGLWMLYRSELNKRREQCRRSITNLLESRLDTPGAVRTGKEKIAVNGHKVSVVGLEDRGSGTRLL